MRFTFALGLAALAASANASIVARQSAGSSPSPSPGDASSSSPSPSSTPPGSSSTTPPSSGSDTTVFVTKTVTGDATSTSTTTVGSTTQTILTDTSTVFVTTTVTSSDAQVATQTVWETTTVQIEKRGIMATAATPAPVAHLAKRATKTQTTTITIQPSVAVVTVTQNVVKTDVVTVTVTSTDTETSQANAKTTVTVTSTRTVSALVVTSTTSVSSSTNTSSSSNNSGSSSSSGLTTGAKAGIGAGVGGAALLAIIGALFFCCRRRNRSPKANPDMMAGASEVPVGSSGGARPMSHSSSTAFRNAPARSPLKPAPEGYRGTAMGDGRAGYAKPESYGSSYGPSRSTTTTVPPSGISGPDSLPEHPAPGSENHTMLAAGHMGSPTVSNVSPAPSKQEVAPPPHHFAQELGTDNNTAAAKWHSDNAAEIDSQPVLSHQSGPVYEMATETYR